MEKQFSISVANPCSEKWDNFSPALRGKFCHSCNTNVVDFTKMNEEEIIRFFNDKPVHTCGRFRPVQLKTYSQKNVPPVSQPCIKWVQAGFLSMMLLLFSKESSATDTSTKTTTEIIQLQDNREKTDVAENLKHNVKGIVIDENHEPLPGVSIYLKGTSVGIITDLDGHFKFPDELKEGDVLVFNYIGFETIEYIVPKNVTAMVEISMVLKEFELLGELTIDETYTQKSSLLSSFWHKVKELF